jgi:transcriptional regulator with XRE-family HTH domain
MSNSIHFGDWLAQEIAKLGINQSEFARRAGVPLPTLRTWLKTPKSEIRGGNLEKLAQGLGKTQDEIRTKLRQAYYERGDASMSVPIMNRPGERLTIRPVPSSTASAPPSSSRRRTSTSRRALPIGSCGSHR